MRKGVLVLLAAIFILFSSAATIGAEEGENEPYKYIQAEIREWFSYGYSSWTISFFDTRRRGDGESVLDFEDLDAPITLGTIRIKPGLYWLTLEGTIGTGNVSSGKTIDTDQTEGVVWSRSESDTDGDISFVDLKLAVRVAPHEAGSKTYLDGFLGYQYYREKWHITRGEQVVPDSGPFSGRLNSSYEFIWESYPVGLKGNLSLDLQRRSWLYDVSVNGTGSLGFVRYRGEGVWNLRSDFEQDPSFKHEADEGVAIFFELGAVYRPVRYVSLGAGYQFLSYNAWNGTDTTFFSDGTEGTTKLDEVNSFRHGPYLSISGRF